MDVFNIVALIIYCLFLLFAVICSLIWGGANFNRVEMNGPYQVGHRDVWNRKDGIALSVWYPMDLDTYAKQIKLPERNT